MLTEVYMWVRVEGEPGLERDVRKRHLTDWQAAMEDQELMQVHHAVLTIRNIIQDTAIGFRRRDLAHLDKEDERDLKCFQFTILTL